MRFEQKKARALALMESKKMWRSNYAPPLLRALWQLGLKIPPLPFASFWQLTFVMGLGFGLIWGGFMWLFTWKDTGVQPYSAMIWSLFGGILFGAMMAAFHRWRKKANNLPDWKDL